MIGWERDLEGGTGDATPVALFSTDSHSRRRRARLVVTDPNAPGYCDPNFRETRNLIFLATLSGRGTEDV
jgi:hypothetical protein